MTAGRAFGLDDDQARRPRAARRSHCRRIAGVWSPAARAVANHPEQRSTVAPCARSLLARSGRVAPHGCIYTNLQYGGSNGPVRFLPRLGVPTAFCQSPGAAGAALLVGQPARRNLNRVPEAIHLTAQVPLVTRAKPPWILPVQPDGRGIRIGLRQEDFDLQGVAQKAHVLSQNQSMRLDGLQVPIRARDSFPACPGGIL